MNVYQSLKINFEPKCYKGKADVAIAQSVVNELNLAGSIFSKFGLVIGEVQEKVLQKRVIAREKRSAHKKKAEVKAKRASKKYASRNMANKGVTKNWYYKDPKKANGSRNKCGCKGLEKLP